MQEPAAGKRHDYPPGAVVLRNRLPAPCIAREGDLVAPDGPTFPASGRERISRISREAFSLGKAEFLLDDVGAEHHRYHLVARVPAPHSFATHSAIGGDDEPFRLDVFERFANERRDLLRALHL